MLNTPSPLVTAIFIVCFVGWCAFFGLYLPRVGRRRTAAGLPQIPAWGHALLKWSALLLLVATAAHGFWSRDWPQVLFAAVMVALCYFPRESSLPVVPPEDGGDQGSGALRPVGK